MRAARQHRESGRMSVGVLFRPNHTATADLRDGALDTYFNHSGQNTVDHLYI